MMEVNTSVTGVDLASEPVALVRGYETGVKHRRACSGALQEKLEARS